MYTYIYATGGRTTWARGVPFSNCMSATMAIMGYCYYNNYYYNNYYYNNNCYYYCYCYCYCCYYCYCR